MALNPQDINNLNKFGAQLNQSVGQMSGTVDKMGSTLNGFATRLEDVLDPEGVFKKGGKKAGEGFKGGVSEAAKLFDKMVGGSASRFAKVIGGVGKGAGLALVGSVVATMFKQFEGLRKTSAIVTKNIGTMGQSAKGLVSAGRDMTMQLAAYKGQWDLVAKTAATMAPDFISVARLTTDAGIEMAEFATKLEQGLGVAAKDTGAIMGIMTQNMGLSAKAAMDMVGSVGLLAEKSKETVGGAVTQAELMSQMAQGSEVMAAMGAKNVLQFRDLAYYTKQRGISMQKVQAFMEGEADYAGILKSTMKTNILLGTKMNAREILRAKLSGNYEKFMDETVGHMAAIGAWGEIDLFKKREMMKLTGLSMKELQRQFYVERKERGLATEGELAKLAAINDAVALEGEKADYARTAFENMKKQAGIMEQLRTTIMAGIIKPFTTFIEDRFGTFEKGMTEIGIIAFDIGEKIGGWVKSFLNMPVWKQAMIGIGTLMGPYLIGSLFSAAAFKGVGALFTKALGGAAAGGGAAKGVGMGAKAMSFLGKGGAGFGGMTSTAGKLAGGAGLAISAVQLGTDIYGAFTSEGKKKKKKVGRAIGGGIGAGIGFWLGGPPGAALGYQVGAFMGEEVGRSMATAAENAMEKLSKEVDDLNKKLSVQKELKNTIEKSIAFAFKDVKIEIEATALGMANQKGADLMGGSPMEKNILQTIFPNIKDLEKQAEAWDKLGLATKMDLLAGATDKLSGMFEDAVTNSDKWQQAELKIKTAENNLAKLANQEKLLSLQKERIAAGGEEQLQKNLFSSFRDNLRAHNDIVKGSADNLKGLSFDDFQEFLDNDGFLMSDFSFGDLFKESGAGSFDAMGQWKTDLGKNAFAAINATMSDFVKQATGADDDLAKNFLASMEPQEKMTMNMENMVKLFDKWYEKEMLEQKTKQMSAVVEGATEKEVAVKEHKETLDKVFNPNKKTGKDMMVKVQDAMVQADSGDEINFAPKGFFNGFTDVTAKVYDQLTSLYTAITTMKKEELSKPATVQTLEAAPVSPAGDSNTVKAINNLATVISDKPIIVTIDGREVARTLYGLSMKVG